MHHIKKAIYAWAVVLIGLLGGCKIPALTSQQVQQTAPKTYTGNSNTDSSANAANIVWKQFFTDAQLTALIDTALQHNMELKIVEQEIHIAANEVLARSGEYQPFVFGGGNAGVEKVGRYTSQGANDATTEIKPGKEFPEVLPNFTFGVTASWEVDIWRKLRNAKQSAALRYLSGIEGKHFTQTQIIAEIANTYYEWLSLNYQLAILKENINIQQNALQIVQAEKDAARVTSLAVKKFEAEVFKNQSRIFDLQQQIVEAVNKLSWFCGKHQINLSYSKALFDSAIAQPVSTGLPQQLVVNRPDIRKAELELKAAEIDISVARASFLPSLRLTSGLGYQAYSPLYLLSTPESMLFNLVGDMLGPLYNKKALHAQYNTAQAKQKQAIQLYYQRILTACVEVNNQLAQINNLKQGYTAKSKEVEALSESIDISTVLFKSARADYMEVLLTQRDALDAKFDLVENKKQQLVAMVNLYKALGGGWK